MSDTPDNPKHAGGRPPGKAIRPEAKRAPEPTPRLSPAEQASIGKISDDELFLSSDEIACVHLSMKKNREAAALRLGWSIKEVLNCLKQPHVKLYAIEFRERFIKTMAQMEVAALKKTGITRSSIESRLMDLALMDPEQTKGSIDGQVKALQALGNIIGLTKDDPLERKSDEELMDLVMSAREKATGKTSPVQ